MWSGYGDKILTRKDKKRNEKTGQTDGEKALRSISCHLSCFRIPWFRVF